eukprot:403372860
MGMFQKLEINVGNFPGGIYVHYDYQGHINSVQLFHENLQKEIKGVDFTKMKQMTMVYDDPFNLIDARSYRASIGFLLDQYDRETIAKFEKLGYQTTVLKESNSMYGSFPYRNKSSLAFGATRFLPSCLQYLLRNERSMKEVMKNMDQTTGTIEIIDGKTIRYYLPVEHQQDFYLTTKEQPPAKKPNKYTNLYYKNKNA